MAGSSRIWVSRYVRLIVVFRVGLDGVVSHYLDLLGCNPGIEVVGCCYSGIVVRLCTRYSIRFLERLGCNPLVLCKRRQAITG